MQWRVENEMCTFVISTVSILGYEKIKEYAEMELKGSYRSWRQMS